MDYINYHYEELLKLLVIISSEPKLQREAHGIGSAEEEMAIDLDFHFNEFKTQLLESSLLSTSEAEDIAEIDRFFETRNCEQYESFWEELETHPDWKSVREMAADVLASMGKGDLTIKVNVVSEASWFSQNVTSQQITVELI